MVSIDWDGKNSFRSRKRAVEDLRVRILRLAVEYPGRKLILIAHSHGGNIVVLAMNEAEVRSKVSRVVCIATPFLFLVRRSLGGFELWAREISAAAWVLLFFPYRDILTGTYGWIHYVPFLLACMSVSLMLYCASSDWAQKIQEPLPTKPLVKTLILRATLDEASYCTTIGTASVGLWMWPSTLVVRKVMSLLSDTGDFEVETDDSAAIDHDLHGDASNPSRFTVWSTRLMTALVALIGIAATQQIWREQFKMSPLELCCLILLLLIVLSLSVMRQVATHAAVALLSVAYMAWCMVGFFFACLSAFTFGLDVLWAYPFFNIFAEESPLGSWESVRMQVMGGASSFRHSWIVDAEGSQIVIMDYLESEAIPQGDSDVK